MDSGPKISPRHVPVLAGEVLDLSAVALVRPGSGNAGEIQAGASGDGLIVDGTLGESGHTRLLLERWPGASVVAFDRDPEMLSRARQFLHEAGIDSHDFGEGVLPENATFSAGQVYTLRAPFSEAARCLRERSVLADFVLLDLGVSMFHFREARRGFSYIDESLDMRLDPDLSRTAADLVNETPEADLADLIARYGEERYARRIAREIRAKRPISSAARLADIVRLSVPGGSKSRVHPATRVFQALRIAVNNELGELERALAELPFVLAPGGVLAIISFHSLEDRLVKHAFRDLVRPPQPDGPMRFGSAPLHGSVERAGGPSGAPGGAGEAAPEEVQRRSGFSFELTARKPVLPQQAEQAANPAARSAKLRGIRRKHLEADNGGGR